MRPEKQQAVEGIRESFSRAKSAVLADYRGLTVAEMNDVRRRLRDASVEFKVVKNTLTTIAVKGTDAEALTEHLKGPTAVAFSYKDPVSGAKALSELVKEHEALELKGGMLGSKLLGVDDITALSMLPSREVLLAQLFSVMNGASTGLVNVLSGNIRNLMQVLAAIREKKENA